MADLEGTFEKQFQRWRTLAQKLLDGLWARPDFAELRAKNAACDRAGAFKVVMDLFRIEAIAAGSGNRFRVELPVPSLREDPWAKTLKETIARLAEDLAKPLGVAPNQPFAQLIIGQALLCREELRQAQTELRIGPGQVYVPAMPAYRLLENGVVSLDETPAWTETDTIFIHRQARRASPPKPLPYGAVHPRQSAIDSVGPLIHERRNRRPRPSWNDIANDPAIQAEYGPMVSPQALSRLYRRWLARSPQ